MLRSSPLAPSEHQTWIARIDLAGVVADAADHAAEQVGDLGDGLGHAVEVAHSNEAADGERDCQLGGMCMNVSDAFAPGILTWQKHMEALVIGALRGLAEAHTQLERATGEALPPLNDLTMFQAAEIMVATVPEDSVECDEPRNFPAASRQVGRNVLNHLKEIRAQREESGVPTLHKIIEQAGLDSSSGDLKN
jgi:hypothetical protein